MRNLIESPASVMVEPAAIILEPIQGNGGIIVPPDEFIQELRKICTDNGVLLIIDEVMSGWGRTGRMFCVEYSGVLPDILVVAKGLGSGLPISAVVARAEIMNSRATFTEQSTFSGNSVSCAAALATLSVLRRDRLAENAAKIGEYLFEELQGLLKESKIVGDIRGKGLMIGIELVKNKETKKPMEKEAMLKFSSLAMEREPLLYRCGHFENVIGLMPPLIINREQADKGLAILNEVVSAIEREFVG